MGDLGAAKQRMHEAKRAYELAKSNFLLAQEDYERIVDKWWLEAIEKSQVSQLEKDSNV